MVINFDMDGTIADLYGVEHWLEHLQDESPFPYVMAKPLINMNSLARILNRLIAEGHEVNIISWTSKSGSEEYQETIVYAKKQWLKRHLHSVQFSNIFIVPYGTPKHTLSTGILFDDEERNREAWGEGAFDVNNILEVLRSL